MKKIWRVYVCMCAVLLIFCGCTAQTGTGKNDDDNTEKRDCQLVGVSDNHDAACINNTIAYFTDVHVCFYDMETGNTVTESLNSSCKILEVSAGEELFYVFFKDSGTYYLRLYHQDGTLFQEAQVPFQRMLTADGMVYTYRDDDYEFSDYDCRIGNIEATHYISEEVFLADLADDSSDWDEVISHWSEMTGDDTLLVGREIFYQYPADGYNHKIPYYCDDKQLERIQQFYFTEYIDGELATPPERAMNRKNLGQLQALMKKKEKNFITYATEVDGVMYGVCNVYKSRPILLTQMDTSSVDYSFSFFYNEDTDSLEKIDEYQGVELIYSDGTHVVSHRVDGIYYINDTTGPEEKILDYGGEIEVNILDGLLLVLKDESNTGKEEEEVEADTVFVKKLWED